MQGFPINELYSDMLHIYRRTPRDPNKYVFSPSFMNIIMAEHKPIFPPPPPSQKTFDIGIMRNVAGCIQGDVYNINIEDTLGDIKERLRTEAPGVEYTGQLNGAICLWVEFGIPIEHEGQIISQTHKINMPISDEIKLRDVVPFYSHELSAWQSLVDFADPLDRYKQWEGSVLCKLCFHCCDRGMQLKLPLQTTLLEKGDFLPSIQKQWILPQNLSIVKLVMQAMDCFTLCFFMASCKELYKIGNLPEVWRALVTQESFYKRPENAAKRQKVAQKSVYSCKILCLKQRLKNQLCNVCDTLLLEPSLKSTCRICGKVYCGFCCGRGEFVLFINNKHEVESDLYSGEFTCEKCTVDDK